MKKLHYLILLVFQGVGTATALELDPAVPPEINIGGRALGTIVSGDTRTTATGVAGDSEDIDFSDSSLLFGFSKYLFNGPPGYGFAVFGLRRPDHADAVKDDLFLHEAHVGVGGREYELKIGRSRLRNNLLSFPTIRDDDLLSFTHVGNASSYTDTDIYEIFGGTVDVQWWPRPYLSTHAALAARTQTDAAGNVTGDGNFNTAGLGVAYALPQTLKFDRGVRMAGIALDSQRVQELDDARLNTWLAGLIFNLNSNPEADWVWELQAMTSEGVSGVASLATKAARSRAKSGSVVTALRFNNRPYLQTRWQAALTLAWKDYPDFGNADSTAIAPSFLYRLGSGVDWVTQYLYTRHGDGLALATGIEAERRLYTGISFSFDYTLNESVADRQSILSIEHNMTSSYGPTGGGD